MLGYVLLLCLDVIYPSLVLLFGRVLGWKGSLASYRGNKRAPGTPRVRAPPRANRPKEQEEGPGMPFGTAGPLSWKSTRESVQSESALLPLHTTKEGCNNKNTG